MQLQKLWLELYPLVRVRNDERVPPRPGEIPADPVNVGPMARALDVDAFAEVDAYFKEAVDDMLAAKHGFFRHLLDFPEYAEELTRHISTLEGMLDEVGQQIEQMQRQYPRLFFVQAAVLLKVISQIATGAPTSASVNELSRNCFAPGVLSLIHI